MIVNPLGQCSVQHWAILQIDVKRHVAWPESFMFKNLSQNTFRIFLKFLPIMLFTSHNSNTKIQIETYTLPITKYSHGDVNYIRTYTYKNNAIRS